MVPSNLQLSQTMCYFILQTVGGFMSKRVLFVDPLLFRRSDISSIVYEPDMGKQSKSRHMNVRYSPSESIRCFLSVIHV